MLSGERISQYAVEKRAGLANGTLNYNCPEYRQVREAIRSLKKRAGAPRRLMSRALSSRSS